MLLGGCAVQRAPVAAAAPAAVLPAYPLERVDGERVPSLYAVVAGSVAVVDLWATWCTACQRERPKLERLYAAFGERGLRVIGVDVGETPSTVRAYLAENRSSYPIYLDPEFRTADALGDHQLPSILVVDKNGRIARRASSLDEETLSEVKALLTLAPPGGANVQSK
jgi:thiol-disulfide isomerase/thioredoxin